MTTGRQEPRLKRERYMATESGILLPLPPQRKARLIARGHANKCLYCNPQGDTNAEKLTGSVIPPIVHFIDGIQLTGSPIQWDDTGLDDHTDSTA